MHLIKLSILLTVLTSSVLLQSSFLTLLAKEQWVEVVPSLGSAVDLSSIRKVSNEYEARLRWKVLNPNIDVYQKFHLPENSFTVGLEHIACSPRGPMSYEVEHWFQTPTQQKLYWKRFSLQEQALARTREEKWLHDTQTPWSQILSPFGSDPRSFVCAYVTAKCAKQPFQWPIPNLTPLEGQIERLKAMNKAHAAKFIPQCHE
jgi:hypothetical protein